MITWLKRLAGWLARIVGWAQEANRVWFAMLAPPAVFMVCWATLPSWEPRIRITGLLLQLMGIATVAFGLRETRKLFRRPSLADIVRKWLKRFPKFTVETRVIVGTGKLTVGGAAATAFGTVSPLPTASLEEKVAALEKGLAQCNMVIHETQRRLEEEACNRSSAIESERRERGAGDDRTQKLIEEAAAGGLHLEATGVFWLSVGVILATASNEIARLLI